MPAGQVGGLDVLIQGDRHLIVLPHRGEAAAIQRGSPADVGLRTPHDERAQTAFGDHGQLDGALLDRIQHHLAEPSAPVLGIHVVIRGQLGRGLRPDPAGGGDPRAGGHRDPPVPRRVAPDAPPFRCDVVVVSTRLTGVGALRSVEDGLNGSGFARLGMTQHIAVGRARPTSRVRNDDLAGLFPHAAEAERGDDQRLRCHARGRRPGRTRRACGRRGRRRGRKGRWGRARR